MLGAIIGDIAGSRFEWYNHKSKDFELLTMECKFTDDTVMSIAICEALMNSKRDNFTPTRLNSNNIEKSKSF